MGCITPIGNNLSEFWSNVLQGKSGAGEITKFDSSKHKTHFACEVKNFSPEDFIEKKELRKMDLCSAYALITADEAIRNAKINFDDADRQRCGVLFSSGIGGLQSLEDQLEEYFRGCDPTRFSPFFITKMILNMPSGLIAIKHNLQGINFAPVSSLCFIKPCVNMCLQLYQIRTC